ncbi:MAG: hypothetical protein CM15mP85_16670 [Rhodobacterales bacterium]|nr:MAG: hypothetical protein CM15mP85_16670 [Rhodobacterales bacterium]
MQMAVIEAARNVIGYKNAGSEEFDHEAGKKRFEPVVYHLKEWIQGNQTVERSVGDDKGGTMRLGAYNATLLMGVKSHLYMANLKSRNATGTDMRWTRNIKKNWKTLVWFFRYVSRWSVA